MRLSKEIYQYLVAGLPEIMLDDKKLSMGSIAFKEEIMSNLSNSDIELAEMIYLQHDANNLLNLLLEEDKEFDELGNFSKEELQEWISSKNIETSEEMPKTKSSFLKNFIARYKEESKIYPNLNWEDQLVYYLHDFCAISNNRFLKEWFRFDLKIRSLEAAITARKYKVPLTKKIYNNSDFAFSLINSKAKDFGLTAEYPWTDTVIAIYEETDLLNREYQLDKMRWEMLDDFTTFNYFSIEVVLAYLFKLNMVNRWMKLDKQKGQQMFDHLIEELQNSYEFPKEFDI